MPVRILIYAATATLAFVLAAGVGAIAALTLREDVVGILERGAPRPADEQDIGRAQQTNDAAEGYSAEREGAVSQQAEDSAEQEDVVSRQAEPASQREKAAAEQKEVAIQQEVADYGGTVGDIQARAVESFLESHNKLLQYDALNADDVQEMKANETALQEMADRVLNLDPPRDYEEHHEVFRAALDELHEAARLAHGMAADPVAATELGFDEYDGRVNEASALLQRSNELLGKDYEAIEGVREVSPEF